MPTAVKSSLGGKHLRKRDYFKTIPSDSYSIMLTKNTTNLTGCSPVEAKIYIETTTDLLLWVQVVAKLLILKTSRWYLTDYRRQRIALKCVPHGQHDYFPTFGQWEHCFPAFPLPWKSSLGYHTSTKIASAKVPCFKDSLF